ncbi:hypothetical protein [Desulfotomaculum sp. 1211_IL3151]|uniref:hypothetical protein n=1 Tax=Desulfotomaculum sp. 1211_IL3151 TaxID=3084055 RepID=UPI002FDACF9A
MRIVFIAGIKRKILKAMRFTLVLTILAILLVQLAGMLKGIGVYSEEKMPTGNSMKVISPVPNTCGEDEKNHGLENIIEQLLKHLQGKK